jgi:hypothetical protein
MLELNILNDYFEYAMPLEMIAQKNSCSTAYVLKVVHYHTVVRPYEIMKCRELLWRS